MSLDPGASLDQYTIVGSLGEGGMGKVYRATDTTLGRDVALKVLSSNVALDPERLGRFEREARLLASLNHSNIAHVYGFGGSAPDDGPTVHFLVMELVEGEDLAQRLRRGSLPLEQALPIARQIAEALDAAHEQGIIHRDLKPANIKVRSDGTVKVLDFGLAKAMDPTSSDRVEAPLQLPTMASPAMTAMGVILGTAAYMAPEQARGQAVDKRADIWAFGVVLYEMLTGMRMFEAGSVAETIGLIFSREPDLAALPAATPGSVRALIARCLAKDPRQRLRDIGDARLQIDDVLAGRDEVPRTSTAAPGLLRRTLPWAVAAVAVAVAGVTSWSRAGIATVTPEVMHVDVDFTADIEPVATQNGGFALAPDGKTVAMIGVKDGVRRLFVRRLDRTEAVELSETGGVNTVTFSPDSTSVAFVSGSAVVARLSLVDQQRRTLAVDADLGIAVTWTAAGVVFNRAGALWLVPEHGGEARPLTELDKRRREALHTDVLRLPGNRHILFSSLTDEPGTERIESVAFEGGARRVVVERATTPIWSPTGHLLFARDGAVLAASFDPATPTVTGPAVPVMPPGRVGIVRSGSLGIQLSATGTLLFIPPDFEAKRVVSVGRDGSELALDLPRGRYANPRVSPDGRRLLVERDGTTLETLDLKRGTLSKLTAAAMGTNFATWAADSQRVVFRRLSLPFWSAADGSGTGGPMPDARINDYPSSPGPNPDSVIVVRIQPETSGDIFLMSIGGKFAPRPLVVTRAYEGGAALSPDGRWLLFQSNASGQPEIYIRRYPALDRPWQVSEGGGVQARWSGTNREIFYRSGGHMMAVTLDGAGAEPVFGKPIPLFADQYVVGQGISIPNYDVTSDGRFIMLRRGPHGGRMHMAINWTEELKQILATGGAR